MDTRLDLVTTLQAISVYFDGHESTIYGVRWEPAVRYEPLTGCLRNNGNESNSVRLCPLTPNLSGFSSANCPLQCVKMRPDPPLWLSSWLSIRPGLSALVISVCDACCHWVQEDLEAVSKH